MQTLVYKHHHVPVSRSVLDNGLTVFTAETKTRLAHVSFVIGSGWLDDTVPGVAHYLEHVLSEGPARDNVHPKLRSLVLKGASDNAMTSPHATSYYADVMAEDAAEAMRAIASVTFEPDFTAQEVDRERGVILQESRESTVYPFVRWYRRKVYPDVPRLCVPEVGWERTIRETTMEDLLAFHRAMYHPRNAACVVTGGIRHEDIVSAAVKLQPLLPCRRRKVNARPRLKPRLPRAYYRDKRIKPAIRILFKDPRDERESSILNLALEVLCRAPFGILHQDLRVERRMVYGISNCSDWWPMNTVFIETGSHPRHLMSLEDAVFEGIARLRACDYPREAFTSAVARRTMFFATKDEVGHGVYASWLKRAWLEGEMDDTDAETLLRTTTPEDLSRIAEKYLRRELSGRIIMTPQKR